jgi:putative ABC transport system permease protein
MRLSSLVESTRAALDTLRAHPLRSALSTSGVIVGVMALTAAFAVTDGVDRWARFLIERESSVQDVVITSQLTESVDGVDVPIRHYPVFTLADWADARREIPGIAGVSLTLTGTSRVAVPRHQRRVELTLATANLPDLSHLDLAGGRFFTSAEVNHKADVVVLNYRLASELAAPLDPLWLLGRSLWLNNRRAEVIGILTALPGDRAFVAFAPISRPSLLLESSRPAAVPALRIKAASVEAVPAVREAAVNWLAERLQGDLRGVDIEVGLERLQRSRQGILLSKLVLGLLVALMLAIGGIGIMNIMLASVTERTQEIGIRKSVGARMADIHAQFLAESLVISGGGSVVGFALGVGLAILATDVFRHFTEAEIYPVFGATTLGLVALAALAVGLVFGTYPARRAARLTVIDAITRD